MGAINFTKMVASGNDFVVCECVGLRGSGLKNLAKKLCDRKYGIGADGLLLLEKSKRADVKMRIFNADGSEAQMCGNGARCVAMYISRESGVRSRGSGVKIETMAGIIESEVNTDNVRIKLTNPKNIRLNIPLKVNKRALRVNFINTGVPHTIVFIEGIDGINITDIARSIRFNKKFAPGGTNVDFVEVFGSNSIKVRTYERGVEDETLACGTGAVASALLTTRQLPNPSTRQPIYVHTVGGETLKVYFNREENNFKNVWLEGKAQIVYKGVVYV